MAIQVPPDSTGKTVRTRDGQAGDLAGDHVQVVEVNGANVDTGYDEMSHTGSLVDAPTIDDALDFLLDGLWFANPSGAAITIQVANGASQAIVPTQQIPGHSQTCIPCHGKPTTGLKWNASAAGLYAQAWGRLSS